MFVRPRIFEQVYMEGGHGHARSNYKAITSTALLISRDSKAIRPWRLQGRWVQSILVWGLAGAPKGKPSSRLWRQRHTLPRSWFGGLDRL